MTDPDAIRRQIAALQAQLAAAEPASTAAPAPETAITISAQDNARLSGNAVLNHVTIGAGGVLQIGTLAAGLPPDPEQVRVALRDYLLMLLERYRLVGLHNLGATGDTQLKVQLRAVYIDLLTDQAPLTHLFVTEVGTPGRRVAQARRSALHVARLRVDDRAWLRELLTADEQQLLATPPAPVDSNSAGRSEAQIRHENLVQRVLGRRTALELVRHHRALVLLGDPGSGKTTVLRYLLLGFALARLGGRRAGCPCRAIAGLG